MTRSARRWRLRWAAFFLAALLCLPLLPWESAGLWIPALSPLLSLGGALAGRHASLWVLMGVPLLILALFRGRWFCGHLCPMGAVAEGLGRLNPSARFRFIRLPHAGPALALLLLGGALAGYPLVIWLDPLSIFNAFFSAWRWPPHLVEAPCATGFLLILLLSLLMPQAWCHRLCPLGASQDLLGWLGQKARGHAHSENGQARIGRRAFLTTLLGGAGAWVARASIGTPPSRPIRPPGTVDELVLGGLCARCGNCMKACPTQIIQPDLGAGGLAGLLAPALTFDERYCDEWCHACTQVCPTGAIRRLSLDEKRARPLGRAVISRKKCLAWERSEYCMVCQEFCPYHAIGMVEHNGVNCPVVLETSCRGCGACESACPARPCKAIIVRAV